MIRVSPGRIEAARPGGCQSLGIERLDGRGQAAGWPVVRRTRREDRADERLIDPPAWLGPGLEQVVQAFLAQPIDLTRREGRVRRELGQEGKGGLESGNRHLHADRRSVPAGVGVEPGPEPLGRLDQGDRVVALGALRQGPGSQRRGTRHREGIVRRAVANDERGGHQGPPGHRRKDHAARSKGHAAGRPGTRMVGADRGSVGWR